MLAAIGCWLLSAAPAAAQQTGPETQTWDARIIGDTPVTAGDATGPLVAGSPTAALSPTTGQREPIPAHRFWDRTNILLFSGVAVFRGLDYASTRNFQARGREEILLPDDVVNNSAGFASLEAAGTVASVGVSYLLHRTGHHKLERWMSIGHIGVTGFGAVRNYSLQSRHPPTMAP